MRSRVSTPPKPHRTGANGIQHYYQCAVFDDRFRECSCGAVQGEDTSVTAHPHADLMLKYALIAHYDDKPWENFVMSSKHCPQWSTCVSELGFYGNLNYRLKPQTPVVQVGQTWVSKEGVDVVVGTPSDKNTIYFKYHLGGLLIKNSVSFNHFIKNFKRKE